MTSKVVYIFTTHVFWLPRAVPTPIREGNIRIVEDEYKHAEYVKIREDTGCYNGHGCAGCGGLLKAKSVGIRRNGLFESVPIGTRMEYKGKRKQVTSNVYSLNGENKY